MTARRIVFVQAAIAMICAVVFSLVSRSAGASAVLASGCVLLPTMYYAWIQARTLNATRILLHGVLKMMLTMVLMAACIVVAGIDPVGFFVTFAVLQLAYLSDLSLQRITDGKYNS